MPILRRNPRIATATNDSAAAGQIGEYISSTVLVGSAVSLTSGNAANVTSISLTAGDWDVSGNVVIVPAGTPTLVAAAIGPTSATFPTLPGSGMYVQIAASFNAAAVQVVPIVRGRVSIASTTTYYLLAFAQFSSTATAYGFIGARRAR